MYEFLTGFEEHEEVLGRYREICVEIIGMESAEMPEKDSTVQYVNFRKQLELLFVISTDFEAIMPKL